MLRISTFDKVVLFNSIRVAMRFPVLFLILLAMQMFHTPEAYSTHMAGGFIRYESTGVPHQYQIILTLYRDCSGIPLQIDPTVYFRSQCGGGPTGYSLSFDPTTGGPVPQFCTNVASTCQGGTRYGLQKFVWRGVVTLPFSGNNTDCNRWTLTWGQNASSGFPARNNSFTIQNGGNTDFFIDAFLDDNVASVQSAPLFSDSLIPAYCINQNVAMNLGVQDPNGDSLAFSLVAAQSGYNVPVVYSPGYSSTAPAITTNGININQSNGNISFNTLNPQTTVFVLKMDKYRNGVLIGYVKYDVQVLLGAFAYCFPVFDTISLENCQSLALPLGTITQSGTYLDTFYTTDCKDSVVAYLVTINQPSDTFISRVICAPDSVVIGNQAYHTTGTFVAVLTNVSNCDSLVNLTLTVLQPSAFTIDQSVCSPTVVYVDTFSFNTTGTYYVTLTNSQGCDSVITLNLVVNQTYSASLDIDLCAPQTITVGNHTYGSNGTFVIPLLSQSGCDSVITLHLTVRQPSSSYQSDTSCDFYLWNGLYISQSGRYVRVLRNAVDCDSVVELDITIEETPLPPIDFDTLLCERSSVPLPYPGAMRGKLDWYRDSSLTQFMGSGSILPVNIDQDTTYIYLVFRSRIGCTSPVSMLRIVNEDEQFSVTIPTAFTPNGDHLNDDWEVTSRYPLSLMVFDRWGLLVWKDEGTTVKWDGGNRSPGAYPYILSHTGCTGRMKYKNGIIHLVR